MAPGSGMAHHAVQLARKLSHNGARVDLVTNGRVLTAYLASFFSMGSSTRVGNYRALLGELWKSSYHSAPPLEKERGLDLEKFQDKILRSPPRHPPSTSHVIAVEGQQIPHGFYRLMRLLDIPVTVLVDPSEPITQVNESTVAEIEREIGTPHPEYIRTNIRNTVPIARLAHYFYNGPARGVSTLPARDGPLPILVNHGLEDAAELILYHERRHSDETIGVLLPTTDLVRAFLSLLANRTSRPPRWYAQGRRTVPNLRTPGIVLLTWESARGLEFDSVYLPEFQRCPLSPDDPKFGQVLHSLLTRPRRQLVITYSGYGEPSVIRAFPMNLLDDLRDELKPESDLPHRIPVPDPSGGPRFAQEQTALSGPPVEPDGPEPDSEPSAAFPASEWPGEQPSLESSDTAATDFALDSVEAARRLLEEHSRLQCPDRRILTAEEEVGLAHLMRGDDIPLSEDLGLGFRRSLPDGDERAQAFDVFVLHNLRLVHKIAAHHRGQGLDEEDLFQAGVLGLMRAVSKFDAGKGHKFSTYATWWIRQSISRTIADESRLIRIPVHAHEDINKIRRQQLYLYRRDGAAPVEKIAELTGFSPEKVRELLQISQGNLSLDQPVSEDAGATVGDFRALPADNSDPAYIVERELTRQEVRRALTRLSPKEAEVLALRFGLDDDIERTLEQVGQRFGLTRERIRQIEVKAKASLSRILHGRLHGDTTTVDTSTPPKRDVAGQKQEPTQVTDHPAPQPEKVDPPQDPSPSNQERSDHCVSTPLSSLRPGHLLAEGFGRLTARRDFVTPAQVASLLVGLVEMFYEAGAGTVHVAAGGSPQSPWLAVLHAGPSVPAGMLRAWASTRRSVPEAVEPLASVMPTAVVDALGISDETSIWSGEADSAASTCLTIAEAPRVRWQLLEHEAPPIFPPYADAPESGILLQGTCQRITGGGPADVLAQVRAELGLIFHGLLTSGKIDLAVDGSPVKPRDPFLSGNLRSQDLGTDKIIADGHSVLVTPRVLPHPSDLREEDIQSIGDPARLADSQGFYVRCAGRYLYRGGWLGVPDLDLGPDTALARVEVEIDEEDLAAWGLDGKAEALAIPPALRRRLIGLAHRARQRSRQVIHHRKTDDSHNGGRAVNG